MSGRAHRITEAIAFLRENYGKPLRIPGLARLGMSVSGFHHHFKEVTAMSPLQFQKQLRLQEGRRLLLADDVDAATAGYRVGYDDPSHFSREYKRHFGEPPARNVARLRAAAAKQRESVGSAIDQLGYCPAWVYGERWDILTTPKQVFSRSTSRCSTWGEALARLQLVTCVPAPETDTREKMEALQHRAARPRARRTRGETPVAT